MKWIPFIFIPLLAITNANYFPIAEVIEFEGEINVIPAKINKPQTNIILGRTIYNGDILQSNLNSNIKIHFIKSNLIISSSNQTEIKLECLNNTCHIKLNYGNLFIEGNNNLKNKFSILTKHSEIFVNENEIWMTKSISGKEEIYSIKGKTKISTSKNLDNFINIGEKLVITVQNQITTENITNKMIPIDIYKRLQNNQLIDNDKKPFSIMNHFTKDTLINNYNNKKNKRIYFSIETGSTTIEENQYGAISLSPKFIGNNIKFGYNLNTYIGLSDSSRAINTLSSLSNIISNLDLAYKSKNNRFQFKIGQLDNITFGYGMLIRRYTNTISYPLKQDGGINIFYKSNLENFKLNLFFSSIKELSDGGGIIGIYTTNTIKLNKPLKIGYGIVFDINQFGGLPDTTWSAIDPLERSIYGSQIDFAYEINSNLLNDTYLFGEFSTLNYEENLRYIRNEEVNWDTTTTKQGYERKNSFAILGPGLHWKIGHHRNFKISFSYLSSLYIAPFFSETYHLERVHFINSTIIDSIDSNEAYSIDEKWNNMIKKNYINLDSSAYYLPKDINALLNPTKNVYNKIGIYIDYQYKFRNYYNYAFDFSIHKETNNLDSSMTYYTIGINFDINDGVIQGISECNIYFNQYYTSEPFKTTIYNENTVFGARLGIKILPNLSLYMFKHNIFYDNNLDGDVNFNSTIGMNLKAQF